MIGKDLSGDQGENDLLQRKSTASRMEVVHLIGSEGTSTTGRSKEEVSKLPIVRRRFAGHSRDPDCRCARQSAPWSFVTQRLISSAEAGRRMSTRAMMIISEWVAGNGSSSLSDRSKRSWWRWMNSKMDVERSLWRSESSFIVFLRWQQVKVPLRPVIRMYMYDAPASATRTARITRQGYHSADIWNRRLRYTIRAGKIAKRVPNTPLSCVS